MLEKWQEEKLTQNRSELVLSIDASGELFDQLRSRKIISAQQISKIQVSFVNH